MSTPSAAKDKEMEDKKLNIVVIGGSVRPDNYTAMAAQIVMDELSRDSKVAAEFVDPAMLQLTGPGLPDATEDAAKLRKQVENAAGVILATPEYHGSYSSVIKLVIENLGFPSVLSGKPVALLGVAGGSIGAIKALEHLRSVASHIGAIVLPGPVSVAGVQKAFDEQGRCTDAGVEKRVRGAATSLVHYLDQKLCPRVCLEATVREQAESLT